MKAIKVGFFYFLILHWSIDRKEVRILVYSGRHRFVTPAMNL